MSMSLVEFDKYWWGAAGKPLLVPADPVRRHKGSLHVILFRRGSYQVEQVTLFPGHPVPSHRHPDVDTFEHILTGSGVAHVGGRMIPQLPPVECRRPELSRYLIRSRDWHSGEATEITVAISVQRWLHGVNPTFITDNWEGEPWP